MRERFADLSKPTCAEKFLDGVDKFCIIKIWKGRKNIPRC